MKENNVVWHDGFVKRDDRNRVFGHESIFILFTGLSASGKSTIAHALEKELFDEKHYAYVLDGDNIRHGLNKNLTFSEEDRSENLRRIVEVSKLFMDAGMIVLAAFISPFRKDRDYMRQRFEGDNFLEVYVKCSLDTCEKRDPKGLYKKAREGIIKNYTGVSSPYEEPVNPDLVIDTDDFDLEKSVEMILELLREKNLLAVE